VSIRQRKVVKKLAQIKESYYLCIKSLLSLCFVAAKVVKE
jgi:hypothetical protein